VQVERKLAKFGCQVCKAIMEVPVCTPCGHFFCKACLAGSYAAQEADAAKSAARTGRARKQPKPCPKCSANLHDFVASLQVNQAVAAEIRQYQAKLAEAGKKLAEEKARAATAAPTYEEVTDEAEKPKTVDDALGWRVAVLWPDEGEWYEGVVEAAGGEAAEGSVAVHYDDGDHQEHALAADTFRWLHEVPREAAPGAQALLHGLCSIASECACRSTATLHRTALHRSACKHGPIHAPVHDAMARLQKQKQSHQARCKQAAKLKRARRPRLLQPPMAAMKRTLRRCSRHQSVQGSWPSVQYLPSVAARLGFRVILSHELNVLHPVWLAAFPQEQPGHVGGVFASCYTRWHTASVRIGTTTASQQPSSKYLPRKYGH
jgi:RING-type zinc-finger